MDEFPPKIHFINGLKDLESLGKEKNGVVMFNPKLKLKEKFELMNELEVRYDGGFDYLEAVGKDKEAELEWKKAKLCFEEKKFEEMRKRKMEKGKREIERNKALLMMGSMIGLAIGVLGMFIYLNSLLITMVERWELDPDIKVNHLTLFGKLYEKTSNSSK